MTQKIQVYQVLHKKLRTILEQEEISVIIPTNFNQQILIGDWVEIEKINHDYLLTKLLARKNYLVRPKAANIDWILIIYPINKKTDFSDLLWWILMYEAHNFYVKVIFSKSDLLSLKKPNKEIEGIYQLLTELKIKYYHYHKNDELNQLLKELKNQLVILSGYSGAGKSTFLNHLNIEWKIITKTLSNKNTGRHTTTTSKIYQINEIKFIDSPGFSNLNLDLTPELMAQGWHLFCELKSKCKFSNCLHRNLDYSCAIVQAVQEQKISKELFLLYQKFLNKNK